MMRVERDMWCLDSGKGRERCGSGRRAERERESSGIASMRESERESDNNINNKLTFF
jgi:hypothetical protein